MKDFMDRQPTNVGRRKLTYEDGTSEFVTVEMADDPTREGTPMNREAMMAVQGFEETTTEFGDGVITETNAEGCTKVATFPKGYITVETFTNPATGVSISLGYYQAEDGSIKSKFL